MPIRLNAGNGFQSTYDWLISGFEVVGGCSFNCTYCYAKTIMHKSHEQFFEQSKAALITRETWRERLLGSLGILDGKTLYCATMVDPFQRVMAPYTTDLINLLVNKEEGPRKLVLQTRSPLVVQVVKSLAKLGDKVRVNFTIDTNDDEVRKAFSPGAPPLESRWKAIEALSSIGVPVCITVTPTLPFTRTRSSIERWTERANALPTLTHVVVQEFHSGNFTSTPPEAVALLSSPEYNWFKGNGYQYLKQHLAKGLSVPLMEEREGFAPDIERRCK